MTRVPVLLAASTLALALPAKAEIDGCHFHVNPIVHVALDGPADVLTQKAMLMGHWAVNCTGDCAPNWHNVAQLTVYYASDRTQKAFDGSASEIDQSQDGQTQLDGIIGAKVASEFTGWCYDPLQASDHVTVAGNTIVVPPYLPPAAQLHAMAPTDGSVPIDVAMGLDGDVSRIPVGVPFRVMGLLIANPRGGDKATIHIEGAGVHFARTYGARLDGDGKPMDLATQYQSDTDPAAFAKATTEGDMLMWIEFEGTQSDKVTLHAVAASTGDGNTGGTSDSGSSSGSSSSGCAAAPVGGLALLALALRRRR